MVDVQVISDIHKSEVYQVAEFFDIPNSIVEAAPSGDMYDGRTDEMVFGTTYDFVELYAYYLNWDEKQRAEFLNSLSNEAKSEFNMSANNLEHIHGYNLHKYLGHSPAIHIDVEDASVKGGWSGNYDRFKRAMKIIG